jgi:hypothetical protein
MKIFPVCSKDTSEYLKGKEEKRGQRKKGVRVKLKPWQSRTEKFGTLPNFSPRVLGTVYASFFEEILSENRG